MKTNKDEFTGARIGVIDSKNQSLIGICGVVLEETKNTFLIKTPQGRKSVLKKDTTFEINKETINGNQINKRPEDRIKQKN